MQLRCYSNEANVNANTVGGGTILSHAIESGSKKMRNLFSQVKGDVVSIREESLINYERLVSQNAWESVFREFCVLFYGAGDSVYGII